MSGTEDYLALAKHLSELRQEANLTQEGLAEKAGIALSTLTKIERGAIKNPSVFTVARLARALNTTLDGVLSYENKPSADSSKSEIRFVYFDIHGVITTNWEQSFTELASRFHLEPQAIELAFWRYNDIVGRGGMSLDDFEKALAANLRLKAEKLPFREAYFAAIKGDSDVHDLMREVGERYSIGLFTNIFPGFLERLRKNGAVPALRYAAVVESCEVGAVKPERGIFELAQAQAATNPEHILLVDDTVANLDEAKHVGWQTFWFNPSRPARSLAALRTKLLS